MGDTEPRARPIAKLPVLAVSGTPALIAGVGERGRLDPASRRAAVAQGDQASSPERHVPAAERPGEYVSSRVLGHDVSHPGPDDELGRDPGSDPDGDARGGQPYRDLPRLPWLQELRE